MAIFSAKRRQSALLADGMLIPDGRIDTRDRMALLDQYAGETPGGPGDASGLIFRHERLFTGLADLWEPDFPVGPGGGEPTTWALRASGIAYVLDRKSAIESPAVLGLIEGADLITTDTARFPPGVEIGSTWIIVDRSITIEGVEGQNYNQGWSVLGDPIRDDHLDVIRKAGMVEAYLSRRPSLPAPLKAHYGLP